MRIIVQDGKNVNIRLWLPTGLVLNHITVSVLRTALRTQGVYIPRDAAVKFLETIQDYMRAHRHWVLAEIHRADGGQIFVKL